MVFMLCVLAPPQGSCSPQLPPQPPLKKDDFRSCPIFPTSNASWAFPGESGQEIKFRLTLYIYVCGNRASLDPNMLGQQEGVTFPLYTPALWHTGEKTMQLQDRKSILPAKPLMTTVPNQ